MNDKQGHAPDTAPTGCASGAGGGGDDEPADDFAAGRGGSVAALVVFLSANGARDLDVYPGDPVLFVSEIIASDAVGPAGSLEISAPGERWHKWLRLEARDASGTVFNWPLHLATEGEESVLLDAENGGLAAWWTRPDETPALPVGVYEVQAILDSSAAPTGWKGVEHSAPVTLTVAPLPSPAPPGFELERLLLRARYYLVEQDLAKASAAIDELFALDPETISGLTLQGALFEAEGKSAEALQAFDAALDLFHTRNPDAQEPPFGLIRLHSQALDETAPFTDVVSSSPIFRRGDSNGDGLENLSDAVYTLGYLFLGNPVALACAKAADADDTGTLNISDAVFLLSYLFLGTREPPAPFPECGADATVDDLECGGPGGCPR